MAEKLKVGDVVWVNERSAGGKILKHEWEGKIIRIEKATGTYSVRDLEDGAIYYRALCDLERSE